MNTPNIRYYAKMVNTTQKGKKTPRYTIVARAGYFPALESLTGRDGQLSMNLMEKRIAKITSQTLSMNTETMAICLLYTKIATTQQT